MRLAKKIEAIHWTVCARKSRRSKIVREERDGLILYVFERGVREYYLLSVFQSFYFLRAFQLCHSNCKNITHSYKRWKLNSRFALEHRYAQTFDDGNVKELIHDMRIGLSASDQYGWRYRQDRGISALFQVSHRIQRMNTRSNPWITSFRNNSFKS